MTRTMIDQEMAAARAEDGPAYPLADATDRAAARRLLLDLRERLDNITATMISLAHALGEPDGSVTEVAFWHFDAGQLSQTAGPWPSAWWLRSGMAANSPTGPRGGIVKATSSSISAGRSSWVRTVVGASSALDMFVISSTNMFLMFVRTPGSARAGIPEGKIPWQMHYAASQRGRPPWPDGKRPGTERPPRSRPRR
jgi:hypothetical protein